VTVCTKKDSTSSRETDDTAPARVDTRGAHDPLVSGFGRPDLEQRG
jgi:hypothetical protein